MIIVADTSALYAAFDSAQPEHADAAAILRQETLAISPLVVAELDHLVHRDLGFSATMQITAALTTRMTNGQYKLAEIRPADLEAAHEVREKYSALRLDLADAIGVVLAHRYRTNRVLTLDQRDFRAIAPLTPGFEAFEVLPADC